MDDRGNNAHPTKQAVSLRQLQGSTLGENGGDDPSPLSRHGWRHCLFGRIWKEVVKSLASNIYWRQPPRPPPLEEMAPATTIENYVMAALLRFEGGQLLH